MRPTSQWLIPLVLRDTAMGLANLVVAAALLAGGMIDDEGRPGGKIVTFAVLALASALALWLTQGRRTVRAATGGPPPPPAGTRRMSAPRTVAETTAAVGLLGLCYAAASFALARIDALDVGLWTIAAGIAAGWGVCMLASVLMLGRWQRRHGATLLLRDGAYFAQAAGGPAAEPDG
jgi:hypothetical protein